MGGLGSGPRWGVGRFGLEKATLRTSPDGMASTTKNLSKFRKNLKGECGKTRIVFQKLKQIKSNSIIVEKMVAPKFSTILEFSTIMDFCVVQGNELSRADKLQILIYSNSS